MQPRRHRMRKQARPRRSATAQALPDDDWIMIDGRPYFVAGYTPGGAPYGIFLDEINDLDEMNDDNNWPS